MAFQFCFALSRVISLCTQCLSLSFPAHMLRFPRGVYGRLISEVPFQSCSQRSHFGCPPASLSTLDRVCVGVFVRMYMCVCLLAPVAFLIKLSSLLTNYPSLRPSCYIVVQFLLLFLSNQRPGTLIIAMAAANQWIPGAVATAGWGGELGLVDGNNDTVSPCLAPTLR